MFANVLVYEKLRVLSKQFFTQTFDFKVSYNFRLELIHSQFFIHVVSHFRCAVHFEVIKNHGRQIDKQTGQDASQNIRKVRDDST